MTLAGRVVAYAPGPGRVLAFLEGGYDLRALEECVRVTAMALADHDALPGTEEPSTGGPGRDVVQQVRRAYSLAVDGTA